LYPDFRVGLVSYDEFFTHDEMLNIEKEILDLEIKAFNG